MGRHRHVANVRTDGIAVVLGPLLRDVRIVAAALVDVDSGMVLDAWSAGGPLTGSPDLELIGAQHAEIVRCAVALLRNWAGTGAAAGSCEVVLGADDGCRHLLRTVPDPHGDRLALAVVVDGPQRVLDRVRKRLQAVSVDALTAGPSMTRRPSGGGWSFDPPGPDVPAQPEPGAGLLPPVAAAGRSGPEHGLPRPRDGRPVPRPQVPTPRDPYAAAGSAAGPAMAGLAPPTGTGTRDAADGAGPAGGPPDAAGRGAAGPDPTRPGPIRPGPIRPGPIRPGPTRSDPARSDPARSEPARPGEARPDDADIAPVVIPAGPAVSPAASAGRRPMLFSVRPVAEPAAPEPAAPEPPDPAARPRSPVSRSPASRPPSPPAALPAPAPPRSTPG